MVTLAGAHFSDNLDLRVTGPFRRKHNEKKVHISRSYESIHDNGYVSQF